MFTTPRVNFARPFSTPGLFGALCGQAFYVFRVLDRIFRLWEVRRAPFPHRASTKALICASWSRQTTNLAANRLTKSACVPPLHVFGSFFVTFSYFLDYEILLKLSSCLGESWILRVQGLSKANSFLNFISFWTFERKEDSFQEGE